MSVYTLGRADTLGANRRHKRLSNIYNSAKSDNITHIRMESDSKWQVIGQRI